MNGLVKGNFIYIKCPKNGCMTYSKFLKKNGWEEINLFENELDLSKHVLWGHITNPELRHTKGLSQYLMMNPEIDIDNQMIGKILVSGVFDEHTYSLNMMLGSLIELPIYWIPLDALISDYNNPSSVDVLVQLDGDQLTNWFFKENNINLTIELADRDNISSGHRLGLRDKINSYKKIYDDNYQKLVKNFLEPDIILYNKTIKQFEKKYGSTE